MDLGFYLRALIITNYAFEQGKWGIPRPSFRID